MKLGSLSLESFAALPQRERRMVVAAVAVLAVIFLFGVLLPLDHSVSRAQQRLAKKRTDLSWMQSVAPELAAAAPPAAASGESLLVILDRSAREAGVASSLTTEPAGPNSVSVRLQKAPFDTMIAWLARLAQLYGVSVDSATIEKADAAGLVNAALVLHMG
jgi:type II secretory pathway component PulM